jgi:oligopeptide/dipeptide ABC transporter ATP-binding protein
MITPRTDAAALLQVRELSVRIATGSAAVHAVREVSFDLAKGETLGLVGESGCGKTTTARSLVRLLPPGGRIVGGTIEFAGQSILTLPESQMRALRGGEIGFIFQNPSTSLTPVFTIGRQIAEPLRLHRGMNRRQAYQEAGDLLARVGIPNPRERLGSYPHQLSGGMQQRVMIAIALSCRPRLLIADEPTTALDVTIQAQILELIVALSRESGTAVLLITHNLGIAASMCDRLAVMYAGRVVETGIVDDIFYRPQMPYSWGLLDAIPQVSTERGARLVTIDGAPPDLSQPAAGCQFAPRCRHRHEVCLTTEPALSPRSEHGHAARCLATEPAGWLR